MSKLLCGDNLVRLAEFEDGHFSACVTDPPYGLKFMAKKWDHTVPSVELWREVYRVLKPGAHLLAFFGTRTYHRGVVNIEDAGFEIRDQVGWLYGSGFPKSLNVAKQDGCEAWDGWGTALKPAWEPIVVARKPFKGTVANNVLEHGTGAINIDGCRVAIDADDPNRRPNAHNHNKTVDVSICQTGMSTAADVATQDEGYHSSKGRFPANVIHDGSDEVLAEFAKYGESKSGVAVQRHGGDQSIWKAPNTMGARDDVGFGDTGTAARFFYCAKASKKERNAGLEDLPEKTAGECTDRKDGSAGLNSPRAGAGRTSGAKNHHPTVKPIALMEYLVKLVTPPGGVVLDPFAGSGSTLLACKNLDVQVVGIELDPEYVRIAKGRLGIK